MTLKFPSPAERTRVASIRTLFIFSSPQPYYAGCGEVWLGVGVVGHWRSLIEVAKVKIMLCTGSVSPCRVKYSSGATRLRIAIPRRSFRPLFLLPALRGLWQ